ncbi:MAG: chorismate synthase [Acutalibacteraceae bacterium]
MSSSYGENIKVTVFGQSHSPAIGVTLEGIPAGNMIDMNELEKFLDRRAPGKNAYSTPRKEADKPEFLCGVVGDITCGAPITAIIRNTNTRSSDYSLLKRIPRPGHADYTAQIKYNGFQDYAGGGHFSGRLTAPLCIAGGICKQLLQKEGIEIITRIYSIGPVKDKGELTASTAEKDFPVINDAQGEKMRDYIAEKRALGDSVGGIVECVVSGLPSGLGDPMFGGMENRIAGIVFGIPAVKGLEFGAGFEAAHMTGSENNDSFCLIDGEIKTETNNCGGILGGITNSMPLNFKVAFKPTPSISMPQKSVDISKNEETELKVQGRHDPCIVPRAVPCVEACAAIAIYDALLSRRKETV